LPEDEEIPEIDPELTKSIKIKKKEKIKDPILDVCQDIFE